MLICGGGTDTQRILRIINSLHGWRGDQGGGKAGSGESAHEAGSLAKQFRFYFGSTREPRQACSPKETLANV